MKSFQILISKLIIFSLLSPYALAQSTYDGPTISAPRPPQPTSLEQKYLAPGYRAQNYQIIENQYVKFFGNDRAKNKMDSLKNFSDSYRSAIRSNPKVARMREINLQVQLRNLSPGRLMTITRRAREYRGSRMDTLGENLSLRSGFGTQFDRLIEKSEYLDRSFFRDYGGKYFSGPGDSGRELIGSAIGIPSKLTEKVGVDLRSIYDLGAGGYERLKESDVLSEYTTDRYVGGRRERFELFGKFSEAQSSIADTARTILENPHLIAEAEALSIFSDNIDPIFELTTASFEMMEKMQNGVRQDFRKLSEVVQELKNVYEQGRRSDTSNSVDVEIRMADILSSVSPLRSEGKQIAELVTEAVAQAAKDAQYVIKFRDDIDSTNRSFEKLDTQLQFAETTSRLFSAVSSVNPEWGKATKIASGLHSAVQRFRTQDLQTLKTAILDRKTAKFALDNFKGDGLKPDEALKQFNKLTENFAKKGIELALSCVNMVSAAFEVANLLMGMFGSTPDPVMEMLKEIKREITEMRAEMKWEFTQVQERLTEILSEIRRLQADVAKLSISVADLHTKLNVISENMSREEFGKSNSAVKAAESCAGLFAIYLAQWWPKTEIVMSTSDQKDLLNLNRNNAKTQLDGCIKEFQSAADSLHSLSGLPREFSSQPNRYDVQSVPSLIRAQKAEFLCRYAGFDSQTCDRVGIGEFGLIENSENIIAGADYLKAQVQTYSAAYSERTDPFLWARDLACSELKGENAVERINKVLENMNLDWLPEIEAKNCPKLSTNPKLLGLELRLLLDTSNFLAAVASDNPEKLKFEILSARMESYRDALRAYREHLSLGQLATDTRQLDSHSYIDSIFGDASAFANFDFRLLEALSSIGEPLLASLQYEHSNLGDPNTSVARHILNNHLISDENGSLIRRIQRGLNFSEGLDTSIVLIDQIRRNRESLQLAYEEAARSKILNIALASSERKFIGDDGFSISEKILRSSRSQSLFSNIQIMTDYIQRKDIIAEQLRREMKKEDYKDSLKDNYNEFEKDDRFSSGQFLDYDYYRWILQDQNFHTGLIQYHYSDRDEDYSHLKMNIPVPTMEKNPFPVDAIGKLEPRYLVFRKSDITLQALLSSSKNHNERFPSFSDLNQIVQVMENHTAGMPHLEPTPRYVGDQTTQIDPNMTAPLIFPTTLMGLIRTSVFHSGKNFKEMANPWTLERWKRSPVVPEQRADWERKFGRAKELVSDALDIIRPEVRLAQERGKSLTQFMNDYKKWSETLNPNDKPKLSSLIHLFSEARGGNSVGENFKGYAGNDKQNDKNIDLHLREDLSGHQIDSPEDLFILAVYGSESDPNYSLDELNYVSRPGHQPQTTELSKWTFYGNFYFKYWAQELERVQNQFAEMSGKSFVSALTGIDLDKIYSEDSTSNATEEERNQWKKDAQQNIIDKMSQELQFADSVKNARNFHERGSEGIDQAARRYQRSLAALKNFTTYLTSDPTVFSHIEKLEYSGWSPKILHLLKIVEKDNARSIRNLSESDVLRLGSIDQTFLDSQEMSLQEIEKFLLTKPLEEGAYVSKRAYLDLIMTNLNPILEWQTNIDSTAREATTAWTNLQNMSQLNALEGAKQ